VEYMDEPIGIGACFRDLTRSRRSAPMDWADPYLTAFAATARLSVVTFDHGFTERTKEFVLLKA
jgi:hypothetical protein